MSDYIAILSRWFHIVSVITLLGGIFYARLVVAPALGAASSLGDTLAARFRPLFLYTAVLAVLSGIYNFLQKHNLPKSYHMVFGIKMLLVLHILAAGLLALRPNNAKRDRQLLGIVISGLAVVALSAVLRYLSSGAVLH